MNDLRRFQGSHFTVNEGYDQKTVPEMREALAHTAGLRADTRAV